MHIMLKTILGSAIGGLMAGAVALGVSASSRPASAPVIGVDPNNPYAMTVANTGMLGQSGAVQCQPFQEPVVRRVIVGGREVAEVTCATATAAQAAYYAPQPTYASDIVSMPAQRTRAVARPAATRARPAVTRERVVYREEDQREGRSWGKTAMIIGGSAGGGAGIGGLIGGKKGALIGAAIGGGAATIYESVKR